MGRFSFSEGKLKVDTKDGPVTPEEATAFATLESHKLLKDIDDRLRGIEHALSEGEIRVHRTQ